MIAVPGIGWLAFDGTVLWVFTGAGEVARLDPATNRLGPLTMIDPNHHGGGFGANAQGLWLNDFDASLLMRIDPTSLETVASIAVGPNPEGLAVDPQNGAVWVANHRGGTVSRVDPSTNEVVSSVFAGKAGSSGPQGIGLGLGSVWVGVPNTLSVYRIDQVTNAIQATIRVPNGAVPCGGFAFGEQAVWSASCQSATTLTRIDPDANEAVAMIKLDGYGGDPVVIDGYPWLVVEALTGTPGRLVRIDPSTDTIDRAISLGDAFIGGQLLVAAGSVWVLDWSGNQVLRLALSAFGE